jgi:hypothetical protein
VQSARFWLNNLLLLKAGAALVAAVAAARPERLGREERLEQLGQRERPEQLGRAEHAVERPQVEFPCSSKKNGPTPTARNTRSVKMVSRTQILS